MYTLWSEYNGKATQSSIQLYIISYFIIASCKSCIFFVKYYLKIYSQHKLPQNSSTYTLKTHPIQIFPNNEIGNCTVSFIKLTTFFFRKKSYKCTTKQQIVLFIFLNSWGTKNNDMKAINIIVFYKYLYY